MDRNYDREETKAMKNGSQGRAIIGRMLEITDERELSLFLGQLQSGKYQYLLTLDMGCGNTSAAAFPIGDYYDSYLVNWRYPVQLENGSRKKVTDLSVPTIFGYDGDVPVIGPEAFFCGEAVENFKTVPNDSSLDGTCYAAVGDQSDVPLRRVWQQYFGQALDQALEDARGKFPDISRANILFVVARPADSLWERNLASYKRLIREGTGLAPAQIVTFSEAKASMQYVRMEKKMRLDWNRGVILIDLGASTIDVIYLAYGREMLEYSITMAGRDVDRLLGHSILAQIYPNEMALLAEDELPDEEFFRRHMEELGGMTPKRFSWRMRNMKENICEFGSQPFYYRTAEGKDRKITVDRNRLKSILSTKAFGFSCYDPAIAGYMNGQGEGCRIRPWVVDTWYQHLEKLITYVLGRIGESGTYADTIIVTGGTANLTGIGDCITGALGRAGWPEVKTAVLNLPADYERTVPYGSASYLINVLSNTGRILDFPEQLDQALRKELLSFCPDEIRAAVAPVLVDAGQREFDKWAALPRRSPLSSADQLKKNLRQLKISDQKLSEAVETALKRIHSRPLAETAGVINAFLNQLSIQEEYSHAIVADRVKCDLDVGSVNQMVRESCDYEYLSSFIDRRLWNPNLWRYLFTGEQKPLHPAARREIAANFRAKNTIYQDIGRPIQEAFAKTYDEEQGFGLTGRIMADLERDINQAMFLG